MLVVSGSASMLGFLAPPLERVWALSGAPAAMRVRDIVSTKSDPSAFLAPGVAADLSWLQTTAQTVVPWGSSQSKSSTASWYLSPAMAPDLSWLQETAQTVVPWGMLKSASATASWYLSPDVAPDLGWSLRSGHSIPPLPGVRSGWTEASVFRALAPVDLSWLRMAAQPTMLLRVPQGWNTNPSWHISPVPDLAWYVQHADIIPVFARTGS